MGNLTPNLDFYKPDATEFIDVDVQLNNNWDIADTAVKRLLEYEFSTVAFPSGSQSITDRSKYYRLYSNSVVQYVKSTNTWYQDPAARVNAFVDASRYIEAGYAPHPDFPPAYRIIKNVGGTTAEVEWTGAFWLNLSPLELNTNMVICGPGELPPEVRPTVSKYFNMWAGNTSTDFSMARILIGNDGRMEFKRYGVDPGSSTAENKIEFTGIKYNIEVTG